ncbi:hypothetical protein PsorP6_016503 [Peronosclerospora sorghi]|uniref:Uncharacterized protein n=1 Tax=Peronosclerospora sorghi TaxID=230839 RepID=A0ACC0VQV9_9STRA|nr:hypothetical protein PsorP6_016503 [Peronosclerospora sorghi]
MLESRHSSFSLRSESAHDFLEHGFSSDIFQPLETSSNTERYTIDVKVFDTITSISTPVSAVPNGIKKKTAPQQKHSLEKSSGSDEMDDIDGIDKDETSASRLEAQQFKKIAGVSSAPTIMPQGKSAGTTKICIAVVFFYISILYLRFNVVATDPGDKVAQYSQEHRESHRGTLK